MARSKARTEADSSFGNWRITLTTSITSSSPGSKTKKTFTNRSRTFSERASSYVAHRSKPPAKPYARTHAAQPRDRGVCARIRARLLRDFLRGSRFRRDEHGRG